MKQRAVIVNPNDNVATALANLKAGESLELEVGGKVRNFKLNSDIPFGHKFCLSRIETGTAVIKYGETIGVATRVIEPADHVHVHNVVSVRGRGDLGGEAK